jgi:hypothetical protein
MPRSAALFFSIGEKFGLVPLYTLAEIYGAARNVIWKAHPEEKVLASDMKIR